MNERIKILFFIYKFGNGGAERVILNILNNINYDLFEPVLCIFKKNIENPYFDFLDKRVRILNLNVPLKRSLFKISETIRAESPDIVFSTVYKMNIMVYFGHKISLSKSKLILRETRFLKDLSNFERFLIKYSYNRSDKVIALSKGVKEHLCDWFKVKKDKIVLIYNPVDLEKIEKRKEEKLNGELNNGRFKILACGKLTDQKNFPLLIKSLSGLNVNRNKWVLYILGDGKDRDELTSLVEKLNLKDNIYLLGFKKNPYKYMKNSDLFVLSSLNEGFGNVIVESMVCGTPVLSTDCPYGPGEILDNGRFGWLIPNNDEEALRSKIEFLIKNNCEIERIKAKMYERVEAFDSNKIVKEYEKVFFELGSREKNK